MKKVDFQCLLYARYLDDSVLCVDASKIGTFLNAFNSIHSRLELTLEIENDNKLNFLDLTLIKANEGTLLLIGIENHFFQNVLRVSFRIKRYKIKLRL